ncbi:Uu.00g009430.m01.CDS01 [Anthostomella pinea]|uniref:Uu.00g009430.m01.CDS01 n=1 Tax=Anthostomella pinea TaxID=933095 RepID=A0AAI8VY17_9PEZI|nr:Uu.00g009430.m01.CDS01 [Anthostomella pinea]
MSSSEKQPSRHENKLLPVPGPTLPYWRTELHPLDSHHSTPELPAECDILIIGAGMSGVSVAYQLSQAQPQDNTTTTSSPPPPSIVLLEARQVCSGATGRNGGHAKVKTATLLSLIAKHGPDSGFVDDWDAYVGAQIHALKAVVEREGLDCEFELRRSYDTFNAARDAAEIRKSFAEALRRGDAWTRERDLVVEAFVERVSAVRGARGAVSTPACSLWPYKFVTQLLAKAMERYPRLNLQTETAVLGVESSGDGDDGGSVVETSRGSIRARKVVFATNAYTAGLLPQYKGVITPYKGTAAHLAPPAEKGPVYPHLSHTYNLEYGLDIEGETVDYLNPRPDGGIVVGGGKYLYEAQRELWWDTVDDSTLLNPIVKGKYFEGYMQRNFRGWEDSGTVADRIWTGIQGQTGDGFPHIGQVPGQKNQWVLAGYNGGGMSLIFLAATELAKMVKDDLPFEEIDPIVPKFFKTTEERLKASGV